MGSRLLEPTDDYPTGIYTVLWIILKDITLKYIDETCPRAWFRPVFLPPEEFAKWKHQALSGSMETPRTEPSPEWSVTSALLNMTPLEK